MKVASLDFLPAVYLKPSAAAHTIGTTVASVHSRFIQMGLLWCSLTGAMEIVNGKKVIYK